MFFIVQGYCRWKLSSVKLYTFIRHNQEQLWKYAIILNLSLRHFVPANSTFFTVIWLVICSSEVFTSSAEVFSKFNTTSSTELWSLVELRNISNYSFKYKYLVIAHRSEEVHAFLKVKKVCRATLIIPMFCCCGHPKQVGEIFRFNNILFRQ